MSKTTDLKRKEWRAAGLCAHCGAEAYGKSLCPIHLVKAAESAKRYKSRMTDEDKQKAKIRAVTRAMLAKEREKAIRHEEYLRKVSEYEKTDAPKVKVRLKPMAMKMLESEA